MSSGQWRLRSGNAADPLRCAVLLSGSGSGMEALAKEQKAQSEAIYTINLVISNNPGVRGIGKAEAQGLATMVLDHRIHPKEGQRAAHEAVLLEALRAHDIELVVLSGYMRLLSPRFLQHWGRPVLNIHPSLLPAFPGAHAHRDVLEARAGVTGCTVHLVDDGMDTGLVLAQTPVPVLKGDNEHLLSQRVKLEEHRLYPRIVHQIAAGEIALTSDGRSVIRDRLDD